MIQPLDLELWNEFKQELQKAEQVKLNFNVAGIENKDHSKFWEAFLTEKFPQGSINRKLEKNFAIYILKNNISLDEVRKTYASNGWAVGGLLGWIKKVSNGEVILYNTGELVNWAKENNRLDLIEHLKDKVHISLQSTGKQKLKFYSYEELQNYKEENNGAWLIEKFYRPKSIVILGGKRSTLKSWLGLTTACVIAEGLPFFNFKTTKTNVLFIDRENGITELKKRSLMIVKGLGIEGKPNISFLSETFLKLDSYDCLKELEAYILENKIGLVIGDTFRRLISFEENSADQTSSFFVDQLKPLCERTGACFVLLHHEKKGLSSGDDMDMLRGSSDLVNYADTIIQLERKGNKLTIKQTKQRGAKELEPFLVAFDTDSESFAKFSYLGELETKENQASKVIIKWIIKEKLKEFKSGEARKYCEQEGFSHNSIYSALDSLENKGIIEKGKGRLASYRVSKDLSLEAWE